MPSSGYCQLRYGEVLALLGALDSALKGAHAGRCSWTWSGPDLGNPWGLSAPVRRLAGIRFNGGAVESGHDRFQAPGGHV